MDELLGICIDEIAIEGEVGCELEKLWDLVGKRMKQKIDKNERTFGMTSKFDTDMQAYILKHLRALKQISVKEVEGGPIILVASEDEQTKASQIIGARVTMTVPLLKLIKLIINRREDGLNQIEAGTILSLEPKSVFHYIKILFDAKLVTKIPINIPSRSTNLIIHNRFKMNSPFYLAYSQKQQNIQALALRDIVVIPKLDEEMQTKIPQDTFDQYCCSLTKASNNGTIIVEDLIESLGFPRTALSSRKRFFRQIALSMEQGFVEYVRVKEESSGRYLKCIQFVRDYEPKIAPTYQKEPISDEPIVIGESADRQLFSYIADSLESGVSQKELIARFPMFGIKATLRLLQRLTGKDKSDSLIETITEFRGKVRTLLHFALGYAPLSIYPRKELIKGICIICAKIIGAQDSQFCSEECRGERDATITKTRIHGHALSVSKNSVLRQTYVLAILQRNQCVEIKNFEMLLREYATEVNDTLFNDYKMDRKTLVKTLNIMFAEKTLNMIEVSLVGFGGGRTNTVIVTHIDIAADSEIVRDFIENVKTNNLVNTKRIKKAEIIEDIQVSIQEREGQTASETKSAILKKYSKPLREDSEMKLNMSDGDSDAGVETANLHRSVYGFIYGKIIRAKALHLYLLRHVWRSKEQTIDAGQIFGEMPLTLYLEIIGIKKFSKILDKMILEEEDFGHLTIANIPTSLKRDLRYNTTPTTVIGILLELLQLLGLVFGVEADGTDVQVVEGFSPMYRVNTVGVIYDYELPERVPLEEVQLENQGRFEIYWQDFRRQLAVINRDLVPAMYMQLFNYRNWASNSAITQKQRTVLLSYTDDINTPYNDSKICMSIAIKISLAYRRVKDFYLSIMNKEPRPSIKRKQKRKSRQKDLPSMNYESGDEIDALDAGETKKSKDRKRFESTGATRKRLIWTKDEEYYLTYLYAILYDNRKGKAWNALLIAAALPERARVQSDQAAKKFRFLREFQGYGNQMASLVKLYLEFKKSDEYVIKGSIVELAEKLHSEVTDFKVWLNANGHHFEETISTADQQFVNKDSYVNDPRVSVEVGIAQKTAKASKLGYLYQMIMSTPMTLTNRFEGNQCGTDEKIKENVLCVLLKIICTQPKSLYDPADTAKLLEDKFGASLVNVALQNLIDREAVTNTLRTRPLLNPSAPGRSVAISDKFKKILSGPVRSQTITEAAKYYTNLKQLCTVPLTIEGGQAAVLVQMMSGIEIRFISSEADEVEFKKEASTPSAITFMTPQGTKASDVVSTKRQLESNELEHLGRVGEGMEETMDVEEDVLQILRDVALSNNLGLALLQELYDKVLAQKEIGITRRAVKGDGLLQYAQGLLIKGLVVKVGFSEVTFVAKAFIGVWQVNGQLIKSWNLMDGSRYEKLYRRLCIIIVGHTIRAPGITLETLHRIMDPVLNIVEIEEMVDDLVQRGILQCREEIVCVKARSVFDALCGVRNETEIVKSYTPLKNWFLL